VKEKQESKDLEYQESSFNHAKPLTYYCVRIVLLLYSLLRSSSDTFSGPSSSRSTPMWWTTRHFLPCTQICACWEKVIQARNFVNISTLCTKCGSQTTWSLEVTLSLTYSRCGFGEDVWFADFKQPRLHLSYYSRDCVIMSLLRTDWCFDKRSRPMERY